MKERCTAVWLNNIRTQRLAERVLGRRMYTLGVDEKPIHFNEAGSQNVCTLEHRGVETVRLKTNHAASRERATVMTSTTDDPEMASSPAAMPIEFMIKAQSGKRTSLLSVPAGLEASVAWSTKGSYRQADMLRYMAKYLKLWTPERAAAKDYRVFQMDVARCHIGDNIIDFAWSRGYLTQYHYGGVTGALQVNDTDNHKEFEREFLGFEEAAVIQRQLVSPNDISRAPQEVLDDVLATWDLLDHALIGTGYKTNGLSVALDGSEDELISRDARVIWDACDMERLRREALAEVDAAMDKHVAAGKTLDMSLWRDLVQHPKDPGITPEGFEFEGELAPGERPWIEPHFAAAEEEKLEEEALNAELLRLDGPMFVSDADEDASRAIVAVDGDDPLAVREAAAFATQEKLLRRLRTWAGKNKLPASAREADRNRKRLARQKDHKPSAAAQTLLRRHLNQRGDAIREALRKQREAAREAKQLEAKRNADKLDKDAAKVLAKEKKKEMEEKLEALPKRFSAKVLGQGKADGGGKKEHQARCELVERTKLRSPPLPLELEAKWPDVKANYSRQMAIKYGSSVGRHFCLAVNGCIEELGKYYNRADIKKAKSSGNKRAFEAFFVLMRDGFPVHTAATHVDS